MREISRGSAGTTRWDKIFILIDPFNTGGKAVLGPFNTGVKRADTLLTLKGQEVGRGRAESTRWAAKLLVSPWSHFLLQSESSTLRLQGLSGPVAETV